LNILIVMGIAALGLCLIWAVQSIALAFAGEPLAWPLRFETRKPLVKWTSRVMIHTTWIIILVATPFALGSSPLEWLRQEFPTPVPWREIAIGFSIMFFPAYLMYGVYLLLGWVRFEPQHDQATRRAKLGRRFWGPWPLATLEEGVFRGVLLEQFLRSLPSSAAYSALAIVVSSAAFASVHFIKPRAGRPVWQMAYGYFIVGCLFGFAYVLGGRSLWLPIIVHGTAVFVIEVVRLYFVYVAPRWLIGVGESPQSGVTGSIYILGAAIGLLVLV
jgi:Type II CAAX prenyl endopeptidase Rce1-like